MVGKAYRGGGLPTPLTVWRVGHDIASSSAAWLVVAPYLPVAYRVFYYLVFFFIFFNYISEHSPERVGGAHLPSPTLLCE